MSPAKSTAALAAAFILFSGLLAASPAHSVSAQTTVTSVVSLEGIVSEIGTCVSQEFPSVTLKTADRGDVVVITAPNQYFLDAIFSIRIGDRLRATAFPSLWHDGAFVALEIANLTTGEVITLRDEQGRPLWSNRGGPGDGGLGWCSDCRLGQQDVVSFEGIVVDVVMGYYDGPPYFSLALADGSKRQIAVGPYRYLIEAEFRIRAGDRMRVEAFRSYWPGNTYVGKELFNETTGQRITLRARNGNPGWIHGGGPGGPNDYRMGDCSGWIPPSGGVDIVGLEGMVIEVDMAPGEEFPHFTLLQADGSRMTIVTAPYYLLLRNAFEIRVGDRMTLTAFESHWYEDTYVAVSLNNLTTGDEIVLRGEDGHPGWPNTQSCGNAGIGYGGGAAWFAGSASDLVEINGRVDGVPFEYGDGYTVVQVKKNNGKRFAVLLGPRWVMTQNAFELRNRDKLRIRVYLVEELDGIYVAAEVRNRTRHQTLRRRDESGRPLW